MPAYDYQCQTCESSTTIVRGIADEEHKPICINCRKQMPRAYDSAPAVSFKGQGWGKDG